MSRDTDAARLSHIEIGSVVFEFDQNRRVYADPETGEKAQNSRYDRSAIRQWSGHWRRTTVVNENRSSWVLGTGTKVPKRPTEKRPIPGHVALSVAEVEDAAILASSHVVSDAVREADAETLRRVAELVGVDLVAALTSPRIGMQHLDTGPKS
jgi:hypothetical protein